MTLDWKKVMPKVAMQSVGPGWNILYIKNNNNNNNKNNLNLTCFNTIYTWNFITTMQQQFTLVNFGKSYNIVIIIIIIKSLLL